MLQLLHSANTLSIILHSSKVLLTIITCLPQCIVMPHLSIVSFRSSTFLSILPIFSASITTSSTNSTTYTYCRCIQAVLLVVKSHGKNALTAASCFPSILYSSSTCHNLSQLTVRIICFLRPSDIHMPLPFASSSPAAELPHCKYLIYVALIHPITFLH